MATPLDLGLIDTFGAIFPFLFVVVLVYAILSRFNVFGERRGLDALIALVAALLVLLSPTVRLTINRMAPYFVLFFFFLIFVAIAYMIFGASSSDLFSAMKGNRAIVTWILGICVIIWLGSLTSVVSERGGIGGATTMVNESTGEVIQSGQTSEFWKTITHPKVLGMALILLIAAFTVQRLSTL